LILLPGQESLLFFTFLYYSQKAVLKLSLKVRIFTGVSGFWTFYEAVNLNLSADNL